MCRDTSFIKFERLIPILFLLLLSGKSFAAVYEDPNFEVPSKLIATGGPMVNKPSPPNPDGTREQFPQWELREVDEGVYSFRSSIHRSMFVITDEGVVLVDPMRIWSTEILLEEVRKLTDLPVTHVIYTHNHLDHIRGSTALLEKTPEFIAHELAAEAIGGFPHPEVVPPNKVWGGSKKEFTVGGVKFELLYMGPNHGDGMTFVGLPDKKIMYICDVMSPGRLPPGLMPDFSPRGQEETLAALASLDYERIVNGHEPAAVSSWEAVTATLKFYQEVRAEVRKAMEKTGIDMAPWEIVRFVERLPDYSNWRYYEQWYHPFAGRIVMEEYLSW